MHNQRNMEWEDRMAIITNNISNIVDNHRVYRIPAEDINKVKIVSDHPRSFYQIEGTKNSENIWTEFNIPEWKVGIYFEYKKEGG